MGDALRDSEAMVWLLAVQGSWHSCGRHHKDPGISSTSLYEILSKSMLPTLPLDSPPSEAVPPKCYDEWARGFQRKQDWKRYHWLFPNASDFARFASGRPSCLRLASPSTSAPSTARSPARAAACGTRNLNIPPRIFGLFVAGFFCRTRICSPLIGCRRESFRGLPSPPGSSGTDSSRGAPST